MVKCFVLKVIDIGMKCKDKHDIDECIMAVKSLLLHTHSIIRLHLLTNDAGYTVLKHYFDTWQLNNGKLTPYLTMLRCRVFMNLPKEWLPVHYVIEV